MWLTQGADRRRQSGFLLVEVLVAAAITGLLMVVLLRSFSAVWGAAGRVREEAEAMIVARAVLEERAPRVQPIIGPQQGRSGRYGWTITIAELAVVPNWRLYRVHVVVIAPSGRSVVLETNRLGRSSS